MSDTPATLLDLRFALTGPAIPHDYADALSQALAAALPWFVADAAVALHPLAGLSPGADGWYLSGRTRLTLRLPASRLDAARTLAGRTLRVGAAELKIGTATTRELMSASVLYAHFVSFGIEPAGGLIGEEAFFAHCRRELGELGIAPRLISGKAQRAQTAAGVLSGFSLMVTDLDAAATLRLQQVGLGRERKRGCGVFIPHKSMASVGAIE